MPPWLLLIYHLHDHLCLAKQKMQLGSSKGKKQQCYCSSVFCCLTHGLYCRCTNIPYETLCKLVNKHWLHRVMLIYTNGKCFQVLCWFHISNNLWVQTKWSESLLWKSNQYHLFFWLLVLNLKKPHNNNNKTPHTSGQKNSLEDNLPLLHCLFSNSPPLLHCLFSNPLQKLSPGLESDWINQYIFTVP